MTPAELKSARHALGLSANEMARLLRIGSGRTIRRWEDGSQDVPGPAVALITALLSNAAVRRHFGVDLKG